MAINDHENSISRWFSGDGGTLLSGWYSFIPGADAFFFLHIMSF